MTDLQIFFISFISFVVGAFIGCVTYEAYCPIATFKNCKEIKIDTISYNYRDSTYAIHVKNISN